MKHFIIKVLLYCIEWLCDQDTLPEIPKDAEMKMFGSLYENPTFRKYLVARESYLINQCANAVLEGKQNNSHAFGGQLLEIRTLHARVRGIYTAQNKDKMTGSGKTVDK